MFTYSIKQAREISNFHVAVVQRRQRNVEKSVMHVQSCCFANIYLLLFCCSRCWRQTSPLYWINLRCKEKEKVVCFTTRQSFQRIPFHERWNKSKFPFKLNWEAKVPEVVFILFYLLFAQRTIGTLKKSTTLPTVKWRMPLTQISSPVKKGENEPKRGRRRGCTTRPEFNRFQLCSTYSRPVLAWIALGLVVVVNTLTNRSISESLIVPDCGWFLLENPKYKRVSVYYVPASLSPRQPKLNGRNRRRPHWPFSASELTQKEMDKSGGLSIQN